jgi:uncharacterized protein YciI
MTDVTKPALTQEFFTQVFINGARFDPISVGLSEQTQVEGNPAQLDFVKSVELLKEAYDHRHNPVRDKLIILGMLDTIKSELPTANLNYVRSISLSDVVLHYGIAMRKVEPTNVILDEAEPQRKRGEIPGFIPANEFGETLVETDTWDPVQAEHEAVLQQQYEREENAMSGNNPAADGDFNIDALSSLDLDAAERAAEEKQAGGGEVVEASNECDGGGCKI